VFFRRGAAGEANEKSRESGQETFDFAHIAIADVEIPHEESIRITQAVPRLCGGEVSRTRVRCGFNIGHIFEKVQVRSLLLNSQEPSETDPRRTKGALHSRTEVARERTSKKRPKEGTLKECGDAVRAEVDSWGVG
jgi:hypothetical protein